MAQHHIATLSGHTQEVCGLKWSPDGKYLASGGNDNLLNVWSAQTTQTTDGTPQPVHTFSQHLAAVKVGWYNDGPAREAIRSATLKTQTNLPSPRDEKFCL